MHAWFRTRSILTMMLAVLVATTATAADTDKARAEVDAAVTAMFTAYVANDPETYFSFFADDAMMLTNGGVESPASQYEEEWTKTIAAGGGVVSMDAKYPRSIRISDDGKMALVSIASMPASYKFPSDTAEGGFADASYKWCESLVWTRSGDDWKLVHFHYHDAS